MKPKSITLFLLSCILAGFTISSSAQNCDTVMLAHDSLQFVTNNTVYAMKKWQDTLYIGGNFGIIGKYTGSFIGVDSATGIPINQPTWPKSDGTVYQAVPDGNGGWVLAGQFTRVGDSARSNLAHINAAGYVTAFKATMDDYITTVQVQGGIVYIGGLFTTVNGNSRNYLAALSLTTGALSSWNPNCNGQVNTMVLDGANIYIGGLFNNIGGLGRNNIAAIDIATGIATSWNPNSNNAVHAILPYNDKIYLGGAFTQVGGQSRTRLAAVGRTNGAITTWAPVISSGTIYTVALSRNRLYFGGTVSVNAADTATGVITNWATSGTKIYSLAISGNQLYVGGNFSNQGTNTRHNLAVLDTAVGVVKPLKVHANGPVHTITFAGKNMLIGGNFGGIGLAERSCLASIDLVGNKLLPLSDTFVGSGGLAVRSIETDGSRLYIGGNFSYINGNSRRQLACYDMGTNYTLLPYDPLAVTNSLTSYDIKTMQLVDDYLYIGGIKSYDNYAARIDKVSGAISTWNPLSSSVGAEVNKIIVSGNDVYIAGYLTQTVNTIISHRGLVKHDLTTLNSIYYQFNGPINDIALQNSKLYTVGVFNAYSTITRNRCAAIDFGANTITAWDPNSGTNEVMAVAIDKDRVYIGGQFATMGGITRKCAAVVDTATGKVYSGWRPMFSDPPRDILTLGDTVFFAGSFSSISGSNIGGLARFHIRSSMPTITIGPTSTTICAGGNATFTVTTDISGGSYQWKRNGANVGTNSNTYSYTSAASGDQITCVVTIPANGNCFMSTSATSNIYTVSTTANTTPTASIAAANTVCTGTPVTFTASTNISPGASYQWKVNFANVGTDNGTYIYTPANGDIVSCKITATSGCYSPVSQSSSIVMTVIAPTAPTAGITAGTNPVCLGSSTTLTATTNITNASYQWKVNSVSTGTNNSTLTYVPANNDQVQCIITPANGCYNPTFATSNTIIIAANTAIVPTVSIHVSKPTIPCEGDIFTFTANSNVTGGIYQWKVNGNNAGTNNAQYAYAPANGDVVLCEITVPSTGCYSIPKVTSTSLTSNVATKQVPNISINGPGMSSPGKAVTVTAIVGNAGSNYNINWKNNGTTFANTAIPTANYIKGGGADNIIATITPTGCYHSAVSNTIVVQENTGINNALAQTGIELYPNPFADVIVMSGLKKGDVVTIYDLSGRKTGFSWTVTDLRSEYLFAVETLTPGSYVLEIRDRINILKGIQKILKQ